MIASLPMYWRDETAEAWQAVWRDVTAAAAGFGLTLPELTPPADLPERWAAHWLDPDLILSQTCSLPFRTHLRDRVTYVGTLDFGLDGPPGSYHSVLVARKGTAKIETLALNGYDSQSGYAAGTVPLPGRARETAYATHTQKHIVTGSHHASLHCVANGKADAAYLDAVSYRLSEAFDPAAQDLIDFARTAPTPGLPLITCRGRNPEPLRAAWRAVFDTTPSWRAAAALGGLRGFVVLEEATYLSLPVPPNPSSSVRV